MVSIPLYNHHICTVGSIRKLHTKRRRRSIRTVFVSNKHYILCIFFHLSYICSGTILFCPLKIFLLSVPHHHHNAQPNPSNQIQRTINYLTHLSSSYFLYFYIIKFYNEPGKRSVLCSKLRN
jgi:hypothetical protein